MIGRRWRPPRFNRYGAAVLVTLVFLAPGTAGSWDDDWDRGGGWRRRGEWREQRLEIERDRIRLEEERLRSAEEQRREIGRERRLDELERRKDELSAEREGYYGAILQASEAALQAPRDAYYRKPGFVSSGDPGGQSVAVGGVTYRYESGIFWIQRGARYAVVTAPVGALVDSLPSGSQRVVSRKGTFEYYFGTFFQEREGAYAVVKPPAGLLVSYVPDGYTREQVEGDTFYRFGPVLFRPVFVQGILFYEVTGG